jgi:glycerol dehydrogenase-like iron-containing ADH family enzyme
VVIGAGGGRCSAARAARRTSAAVVNCPTLASSDALQRPLRDPHQAGEFQQYRFYQEPDLVLVDR